MTTDHRLLRLERHNRLLTALLLCCLAGALSGYSGGVPELVTARAFRVIDENGTNRIDLVMQDGQPCLSLNSDDGTPQVLIYVSRADGATIGLTGVTGRPSALLFADREKAALLLSPGRHPEAKWLAVGADGSTMNNFPPGTAHPDM